jgi:hypothetical protein
MVKMIAAAISVRPSIVFLPPGVAYQMTRVVGWFVNDVVITREEIRGLMEERLYGNSSPLGTKKLSDWVHANGRQLELARAARALRSFARAKKGATGGKHDHRSLPAAGVIAAVGSIYFAWRNREFRKFLAGRSSCHRVFCSISISPMFRCRCCGRVLSKHLRSAAAAPSSISSSSCSASISWRPHFQSNAGFEW